MSRVPLQKHFYCSAAYAGTDWIIYESCCKARNISGDWCYRVSSRHYAYKLARLLNQIYHIDYTLLDIIRYTLAVCYRKDYEQSYRMCEAIVKHFSNGGF